VTYSGNGATGGSVPTDTTNYATGATVTVLGNTGNLVRTGGYTFIGWNTASDGSGITYRPGNTFAMGSSNVILYAKWTTDPTYTVTYNGNGATGGTAPSDPNNYEQGDTVTVLGNTGTLVKTHFTFAGWNTAADGTGTDRAPGSTFTMGTINVTLFAKWTANPTYTVTYNGNGNTGGTVPVDSSGYEQNQVVTVLGNTGSLVRTHFTFAGWNTAADGTGTTYTQGQIFLMGSANVILYAKWTANPTYTVTYDGNGSTGGSVPTDSTSYETGNIVTVLGNAGNLVKTGSTFVGWNTASNGSGTTYTQGQTFTMGSANVILYAKWTTNPTYTVTYNGNGSTGGNPPVDANNYEQGATVTVLGNTGTLVKTHFTFAGWNTAADGTGTTYTQGQTFSMGSASVTLYAIWTANPTYTVTYNGNGSTSGSVPTDSTSYETGNPVTVLGNTGNLVKTGSTFAGWNTATDGSGTSYIPGDTFAMGSANVILYAIWVAPPVSPVTFTADGVSFKMVQVPGKSFKTGTGDTGTATVASAYWIGETEVTYELWDEVYEWAIANSYFFQNAGAGSGQQPVTTVNWRDAMVWTNAATEWCNAKNCTGTGATYTAMYTYGGSTIKDSRDSNATACDAAVVGSGNGFRLLTSNEWELAARYKVDANGDGDISDPGEYYPGNYASGATAPYTDATATGLVAWYSGNAGGTTHDVKTKAANALGLYDMSGNVWEWCFDLNAPNPTRIYRGGSWTSGDTYVQLGWVDPNAPTTAENKTGFRLGRTP
jgi:uncharacterized repeat protein (TIGR02543 family)